ncbi:MAG TPA: Pr6Pr family membrane protein [Jiangellaceae bacterium]
MPTRGASSMAGRLWQLVTIIVVLASLGTQLVLVVRGVDVLVPGGRELPGTARRVVNFFSYFTVQSNLVLAVGAATLLVDSRRDGPGWRVLRFAGVLGIAITGIVFVTVLRPIVDLDGVSALTNVGMHYAAPLLGVVGWLLFGPRPRIDARTLLWTLAWPIAWLGYILVWGAATDWYPYPFVDVAAHGYGQVLLNSAVITVLFLAVAWAFMALDRRLGRAAVTTPPGRPAAADRT